MISLKANSYQFYRDEYRLRLPTDKEAGRVRQPGADEALGVEIEDWQN